MRTLLKVVVDTDAGNELFRAGTAEQTLKQFLEVLDPEAVYGLAEDGHHTLFAVFDLANPPQIRQISEPMGGRMDVLIADLSPMAEVRRLAKEIIDVLVNHAGVAKFPRGITADGLETTFATNHLAPFLPTNLLRDQLIVRAPARVVTVASSVHGRIRAISWDDLQAQQRNGPNFAYGLSKLLNLLFTAELARRLAGTGVTANSVYPGCSRTELAREAEGVWRLVRAVVGPFQLGPERAPRPWSTRRKPKRNRSTKADTPKTLKRLVQSSILDLSWGGIAAVVAIVLNLPAEFGGSSSGLPVVQDFLYFMGTALSPPLLPWMVPQALLIWLAWNQTNRRSTWGVIGLALFGALEFIGGVGEPITYEVLNPVTFNPLLAVYIWKHHYPVSDDGVCYSGVEKKAVRKQAKRRLHLPDPLGSCE